MNNLNNMLKIFIFLFLASVTSRADSILLRVMVDNTIVGDVNANFGLKREVISLKGTEVVKLLQDNILADKIERIVKLIDVDGNISLENLARIGVPSEYNEKELRITLVVPLDIRTVKDFSVTIASRKTGLALTNKNYSGYLNFRGLIGYSDSSTPTAYTYQKSSGAGQLELVQNLNFFTFESTFNYKEFEELPLQRNDSSLVHDFEDRQMRLRLGDFYTGVQGFQTSIQTGGLQFQKQFSIYPHKHPTNRRSTSIRIKNNSQMEVFVNNNLILRTRVNVGIYNLKELPLLYGVNKVRVLLKDDFGGQEEFEVDLLFDDQILVQGVHDFSYQVGNPAYYSGNEKRYYKDSLSSFYHKYGLTDNTTVFFNYQNYLSSNLVGLGVGNISKFGTNFLDLAGYSDGTVKSEKAALWRYNTPELNYYYFGQFRLSSNMEFKSLGFNSISIFPQAPANYSEKYDLLLQKQLTDASSMSLGFTKLIGQNLGADDLGRRFAFQSRFAKNWRFDLSYAWTERQKELDQILVSFNWQEPAGKALAAFSHDTVNRSSSVRVSKSNQVNYNDLQLSMYADKQRIRIASFDSQNVDLSANYYAAKYEARAQIAGQSNGPDFNSNGQLGFGSAIAWTTDGGSFSRPITDSFAILEAQNVEKGQYLTIPKGVARDAIQLANDEGFVFSNMGSYIELPVRLDSTNLGLSSHLDRESYLLTSKYRSGIFVPLKVVKSLVVMGKLTSANKNQVEYAHGKILTDDGKIFSNDFFTDESGNFVLDGLTYGKYHIELSDSSLKKISFELVESDAATKLNSESDSEASEYQLGVIKIEKETGK